MPKKSILATKNLTLSSELTLDEKIFKHLRIMRNNNPNNAITQTSLAAKLGVKQSTISRHLNPLIGREYHYDEYYYKITCVSRGYKMIREEKPPLYKGKVSIPIECRVEEKEIRAECADEIINSNCLVDSGAIEVSEDVVLYPVQKKKESLIVSSLRSGFPEDYFYDIIPSERGVYIILNSKAHGNKLKDARDNILNYYASMLQLRDKFIKSIQKK